MGREPFSVELRGVVYFEAGWWIAHCLELDIVAEGKTPTAALRDLMDLARVQVETAMDDGDLESIFRPAPPNIWSMFAKAEDIDPPRRSKKPVDRFSAREVKGPKKKAPALA